MATVLVVDDEPHLLMLYRQELSYQGYEVLSAESGAAALAVLQEQPVDIVVLDIAMPGMDGIETLRRILAVSNQTPVILNTAYGSYRDDFMTWAAVKYVVKSSDVGELAQKIAEVLKDRGITPPEPRK
jgi:two-component system response regulator (stage 0 sporulation protein F)